MKYKWRYTGHVMVFDKIVTKAPWSAETIAVSESKAKANLAFRVKQEMGLSKNARVSLPGTLVKVSSISEVSA